MPEPLRATFFALRRRARGGVLTRASVAYAVIGSVIAGLGLFGLTSLLGWAPREWGDILAGAERPTPDVGAVLWMLPLMFAWLFAHFLLMAAYESGCLRWMIHGEVRGWFGLTMDDDAWRIYGAYWVWAGVYLVWAIAFGVLAALLNRLLGENHWGVWTGLGLLALCAAFSVVALSPAAATCMAKRRFAFFEAVNVSEDRFLALAGSFALILGGSWLLSQAINAAWWTIALGPAWLETFANIASYSELQRAEGVVAAAAWRAPNGSLTMVLATIASTFVGLITGLLLFGVNARAVLVAIDEGRLRDEA